MQLPVEHRVSKLETAHESHETLCLARHENIQRSLAEIKDGLGNIQKAAFAVVMSLLAFAFVQLWDRVVLHAPSASAHSVTETK